MAFWERNFNQTATWEKNQGLSDSGQPSYGNSETIDCRIVYDEEVLLDSDGNISEVKDVMLTSADVERGDRITVDGDEYEVSSVKKVPRIKKSSQVLKRVVL